MMQWLGNLLGVEQLESVHDVSVKFAAPWAEGRPALVLFACVALAAVGVLFYARYQKLAASRGRIVIATLRAMLLALLVAILAEPVLALALTQKPKPLLLWLFDGTQSMSLKDRLTDDEASAVLKATAGADGQTTAELKEATRLDVVRQVLIHSPDQVLEQLAREYRLRAYVMDRVDQVRELDTGAETAERPLDVTGLVNQVRPEGQVTAIGAALDDLGRRHRSHLLAGVVMVSDFDQNAGQAPLAAAERLGVPLYTVGVGPREVVDLAVELQTALVLKKDERTSVTVHLRQSGLQGRTARVQLLARSLGGEGGAVAEARPVPAAPAKTVDLTAERVSIDIPFVPTTNGRTLLQVKVDPFDGEVIDENNLAQREVNVRDDSLKMLFVEYEPTWEWRFIKEVFHRDPLVGREGFRTFLRSADFKVRRTNDLFIETLVQARADFFASDVILISDVPGDMMPEPFQEMVREFVETFGGGLVVIGGPRFGPGALSRTKLADMLPVIVDPAQRIRVGDFRLRLTPKARDQEFMNLGADESENRLAWNNLGALPWYQPVVRPHPLANVLAEHPIDRCVDNQTPQPLIATRRFGKGEVIYLGFNETWRFRPRYGEKYYRQFWGQMINRLRLGRALGSQKRFQVYTDRPTYQAGDKVRVTVEAYNENFEPLSELKLTGRLISEERDAAAGAGVATELSIPLSRDKVVFETSVPVYAAGAHRLLVRDPITSQDVEVNFKVAPVTVEKRNAVRDAALQQSLANQSGGKHYEVHEVAQLLNDLKAPVLEEKSERRLPLWNTWFMLVLVIGLMLGEWLIRKLMNLR